MKLVIGYRLFIIVSLFFTLNSCRKEDKDSGKKTIDIGVLLPLSGTGSSTGESSKEALNFAMEDITNYLSAIGSDYKVNLFIEDTQTDTTVAKQKIASLAADRDVQLVLGPYSSSEVKAVKAFADNNNVLVVSASSVATSLAIPNDNIFRLVPCDFSQAEALDAWLSGDTIEILVPIVRDDIWGRELLAATTAKFTSHSGIVADAVYYSPADQDFTQEVQTIAQKVQDYQLNYPGKKIGVYLVSFNEGAKILSTEAISNFIPYCNWYGSSAFANNSLLINDFQAAAYAISHRLVCPVFGLDEAASDKWKPLMDKLQQKLGRKPEVYAYVIYDALWLAVLTYLNTGIPVDIDKLKTAFTGMAGNYYGVTGRTTLNEYGDRAYAIYDFWSVRLFMNEFSWVKSGWYDNKSANLVRF